MHSTVLLVVLLISGFSISNAQIESSSIVLDLFIKTLIRTFETPIILGQEKAKFSVDIMLDNDVFSLDDALRLFLQQFIVALLNGRIHLLPNDWETEYPAYSNIINEINKILDLVGERKLSEISMKDIRPFIKSLTPTALLDTQRLINDIEEKAKEETVDEAENSTKEEL